MTLAPYFSDESVTLYLGDCREIMPTLELDLALVLADPPYGDTSLEWDQWVPAWPGYLPLAPQMWCFGSMRMFMGHAAEFAGWKLGPDVVWKKQNGTGFDNQRPRRVHEHAIHWYKGAWGDLTWNPQYTMDATKKQVRRKTRPTHTGHIEAGHYTSEDGGPRLLTSVIEASNMHGAAIHPTEKPIGILEPLIRYSTHRGDLILDPFGGSCSTARAAKATGRRAVCIEANEAYLEAAVKALGQGVLDFGAAS